MIQRIQTVYLFVGAILVVAAAILGDLFEYSTTDLPWFVPVVTVALALALLASLGAVFMYRRRERQRTVVVLAQILVLGALVALFIGRRGTGSMPGVETATTADWLLFALPVVAYLLFLLARRAIDRDIRLLKSVDRLR